MDDSQAPGLLLRDAGSVGRPNKRSSAPSLVVCSARKTPAASHFLIQPTDSAVTVHIPQPRRGESRKVGTMANSELLWCRDCPFQNLLMLDGFVRGIERRGWLIVSAVACACGMASKEVMVTAPVLVLL